MFYNYDVENQKKKKKNKTDILTWDLDFSPKHYLKYKVLNNL